MSSKNSLKLTDYDIIGLDFDNTLMQFNLENFFKLIYKNMTTYLKEKNGYAELDTELSESDQDLIRKGLFIDIEAGNILLIANDGKILHSSHGTKKLTNDEIIKIYGLEKRWESADSFIKNKMADYQELSDTLIFCKTKIYFDNMDAIVPLVFAKLVDLADKYGNTNYEKVYYDLNEALSAVYDSGSETLKYLANNKSKFVFKCEDSIINWLTNLSKSCKLMLLTSGDPRRIINLCKYILNDNWKNLFHTICYVTRKPNFFYNKLNFKNLNGEIVNYNFNGGEFCGGNWQEIYKTFSEHYGRPVNCLYIGDSLLQDIYAAAVSANPPIDTIIIMEEVLVEGYFPGIHPYSKYLYSKFWGPYFIQNGKFTLMGDIIANNSKICIPSLKYLADKPINYEHIPFWNALTF